MILHDFDFSSVFGVGRARSTSQLSLFSVQCKYQQDAVPGWNQAKPSCGGRRFIRQVQTAHHGQHFHLALQHDQEDIGIGHCADI